MMVIKQPTSDLSDTLYSTQFHETYHSTEGAILEANHVYISPAFDFSTKKALRILEIGFGTGLNALLTYLRAVRSGIEVDYEAIEPYPLQESVFTQLNYSDLTGSDKTVFLRFHRCRFDETISYPFFRFVKKKVRVENYHPEKQFDVIYYDAFSPDIQPEIWTVDIFATLYGKLSDGGVLLTYSSKGIVKRALRTVGFTVNRLQGAGHKRHMVMAAKLSIGT